MLRKDSSWNLGRRLTVLGIGLGALAIWPWVASAQLSCSIQGQAQLLGQFSDFAPAGSIPPGAVRNVICSGPQLLGPGLVPVAETLGSSPYTFTAPLSGVLTVTSGEVELTRNSVTQIVSLTGGTIRVVFGDVVTVLWFHTTPTIYWLGDG